MPTSEQKILAVACHIGYLAGGITFILLPLAILIWKKDDYFVYAHAKQALVAQALVSILGAVVSILTAILIGILLWPVLILVGIVFFIVSFFAAWAAFNGEYYKYPFIGDISDRL